MLRNFVKCALPAPGAVNVGSTLTLGAPPVGFSSWLGAFGGSATAYFFLSDGADRTIAGVWTINATTPETATISQILWNRRLGGTAGETFSTACTAWNEVPAEEQTLLRSGPLAGLRNLIINGNPLVNQRSWASGAAVGAANTYTLDRWRVVVSGQGVSWSDSGGIRTVNAPSGGVEQVIEGLGLVGGVYTINWTGSAACTVGGSAVAKGTPVTLLGGAGNDVAVRFSAGTFSVPQLEPGPIATPFERRPIALETLLCQRYFETGISVCGYPAYTNGTIQYFPIHMVRKRVTPTVLSGGTGLLNIFSAAAFQIGPADFYFDVRNSAAGNSAVTLTWTADAEL